MNRVKGSTGRKTLDSAGGRLYWTAYLRMTVMTIMAVCALMYAEEGRQRFPLSVFSRTVMAYYQQFEKIHRLASCFSAEAY